MQTFATSWFRAVAAIFFAACVSAHAAVPDKVRFNEHVRSILSNNCFFCHGPDEKHREAKLRLDERESALADHDGETAIVPGHPEKSALLDRITSHDADELMPPAKSKKPPLSAGQVAILKKWIEQGAEYEGHWAFLPLANNAPPQVKQKSWLRNPIDNFILARLDKEGIKPSAEADRATLIRRVSLDLTGLLPTPEEVRNFAEDKSPDAYEKLVDRLLASPHYGERWGRHWLDHARYADSNGYSIDAERQQWPYRDWVIKALNDDMPFDRFTIEQLAGDLLPHPTKSQIIATAFHRNTLINQEGGVKPEQFRFEETVDRVNTTGAVWLGLTVGCAQCHSHKFDPIAQREFYQMLAFFNQSEDVNNIGPTVRVVRGEVFGKPVEPLPTPGKKIEPQKISREEWEKKTLERLSKSAADSVKWSPAQYVEYGTESGAGFRLLDDNSLLGDGRASANDTYRVVAKTSLKKIAAVRLRVLTHDSLPKQGPGFSAVGNFVLTQFEAHVGDGERLFSEAYADYEQPGYGVSGAIDDNVETGWGIEAAKDSGAKTNANHEAVFVFAKPVELGVQAIEFKLHHGSSEHHLVGRFAIEFSENVPANMAASTALLAALRAAPEDRDDAQKKILADRYAADSKPAAQKQQKKSVDPNVADLMVMRDLAKPRETFIQIRGDYLRPDEKAGPLKPGVIAAVSASFRDSQSDFRNRLDLAKWLVDLKNPLTPRVQMNRVWLHYFGRGIVETDEDFGTQGSGPVNPELLDFLAREFVRRGWSLKKMHRLIVTSATYRQSSHARPDLAERDPRNLLLARQERVRVEAEIVRDAALSASGLLSVEIGGPSVHPPQPEGVYSFTQTNKKWVADTGANRFRRTMYTMFYRSAPYPLLTTFDEPEMQTVCTRRARSNTPLQALNVANDPVFVELAQGLAARVLHELPSEDSDARLRRAFALTLCREPSQKEFQVLSNYYAGQLADFSKDADAAKPFLSKNLTQSGASPETAAALVCVSRALFNTDNFITRE